jgi:hypothetical protein
MLSIRMIDINWAAIVGPNLGGVAGSSPWARQLS